MQRILLFVIISISVSCFSQHLNIPFLKGQHTFPDAGAAGFGGASVANPKAQSLQINPAGIVQQNLSTVHGSLLSLRYKDIATFDGQDITADDTFSKLNNIGLTIAIPTIRGALVFGVSHQRYQQLDGIFQASWAGTTELYFENQKEYVSFDVDKKADEFIEGHLSKTAIGGGTEIAPGMFTGLSLNFHSGKIQRNFLYDELGGIYDVTFSTGEALNEFILGDWYETHIQHEIYSGINFTGGFQYQAHPKLLIGATLETPLTLKADRDWSIEIEEDFSYFVDPDTLTQDPIVETGSIDYKIQKPWILRLGCSFNISPLTIAADIAYKDYSQIKYETEYPEEDHTKLTANQAIRNTYREVLDIHIGGQVQLPKIPVVLRGGYAHLPTYLKEGKPVDIYSVGAGANLNEQFQIDASVARAYWYGPGFDIITQEKIESTRIQISMKYIIQ